ncbi:methyltransferase domain-containing protein [Microbacterium sp. Marseille-Q6965]|uniref:methyltransferase domain-containing protein n=1 Tax=Microbacterium sp. Marseille-Q6965 TaxID=2965072 RepID=UPI0021B8248C|nr:methyltransferase domain-containing protein [Microbacterium sp. Marseille-Q6965]
MAAFLAERDAEARELMDDPACDVRVLERTYRRFPLVNAFVSGQRAVYRRWLRPRATPTRPWRVLDVGTGGADMPRRLLRWARRDGLDVHVVAIDPDPRAIDYARRRATAPGLELRAVTTADLRAAGERFDAVLSNHVLHHLSDDEVKALLDDTAALVTPGGVAVHADIERSSLAYAAFAAATWPLQAGPLRGTFIRPDGLTSIRRSRTAGETAALAPRGWRVRRGFPSRLELVWGGP